MNTVEKVLMVGMWVTIAAFVANLPFVYFWVTKPFDKLFGDRALIIEKGIPLVSFAVRTANYCIRIQSTPRRNWYDETMFGGFVFRDHASRRQRIVSHIYVNSIWLFLAECLFHTVYVRLA